MTNVIRNSSFKILIIFLFAFFAFGATQRVFAHPHPELFELDQPDGPGPSANATTDHSGSGLPDDWDRIGPLTNPLYTPANPGPNHSALSTFSNDAGDSSVFTTGGSKDINDINQWRWVNTGVLDKDNLLDGYAALYPVGDSTIIYFGADRYANNGDADLGFWFFVNNVDLNSNGTFTSNGADTATHTDGDILLLTTFTGGGGVSTIELFRWDGTGDSLVAITPLPDDDAAAAVNDSVKISPWAFAPKNDSVGYFQHGEFFEGGINLTALLGSDVCFSSFLAETRSSQELNAQLKDFILEKFPSRPEIAVAPDTVCAGDAGTLCPNITGGFGPFTYLWTGPGGFSSADSCIHPTTAGQYFLSVTGANHCVGIDSVSFIVSPKPVLSATGDELTCDSTLASTVLTSNPSSGITIVWSGTGLVSGQGTTTARWNAPGTKKAVVTITGVGCVDSTTAEVTQNNTTPVLSATGDELTCDSTNASTVLTSTPSSGITIVWSGTGLVSGQGTLNARWSSPGTKKAVVTINATGCKDSTTAEVTQNNTTPVLSATGDELTCDSTNASTVLTSTPSSGITIVWSGTGLVSGQGTLTARWSSPGTKKAVVTINATGCKDSTTAELTQNITPPVLSATGDELTCDSSNASTVLTSNPNTGITIVWSGTGLVSGQGTLTARWSSPGTKKAVVTINATGCKDSTTAEVTQTADVPVISATGDELTCDSTNASTVLTSNPNTGITIVWSGTGLVSGQGTFTARWSSPGTKKVVVTIDATGCTDSTTAEVTQNNTTPVLSATGDELTCDSTNASTVLTSNPSSGITIVWSGTGLVSGQGTLTARWSSPGTKKAVVTINATGCKDSTTAEVTQNNTTPVLSATGDQLTCDSTNASTDLTSNPNSGITIVWSGTGLVSGQGTFHARWSSAGTKKAVVTINATGCKDSTTAEVTEDVLAPICSVSPSDTTVCEGTTATFCVIPSSGRPPFTFTWSGPNGFSSSDSCITVSNAGIYMVFVEGTNGCADTCQATLNTETCGQEFCSLTQGAYGNPNGVFNGMRRLQLIQSLLSQGPLIVGKPGRSLTINYDAASCVIQRLPANSGPKALPATLGNAVLDPSTCETSPTLLPLQNGKFKNVLLGQTIALGLNLRLGCDLGSFSFCPEFDTREASYGPDGVPCTGDDFANPDTSIHTQIFVMPQSVLDALANLGLPVNAAGLFELANRALAGQPTGGASLADINQAVDNVNTGFDECSFVVYCGAVQPIILGLPGTAGVNEDAMVPTDFFLGQSYPNPFNPTTTIDYGLPQDAHVSIDVFDILGRKVTSLVDEDQTAGYHQVTWNAGNVPSGVYFYRIDAGSFMATKKMILMK